MADKLYKEEDVARIAGRINSYTGLNKAYKLREMADGVDEAVRAGDISTGVLKGLIERSLTELDIPLGTTRIGSYAFEQYRALTKITIPETVTKILNHAFHDCTGLTDIVIPDSVTEIGTSTFHGCNSLKSIKISDNIKSLPGSCFYQCSKLSPLTLPAALEEIRGSALKTTGNGIFDFTKCKVVPVLASGAFHTLTDAARIYVPPHLYDAWVVATNWAALSDHIVPKPSEGLEYEYTEGGYTEDGYMLKGRGSFEGGELSIPEKHNGEQGEMAVVGISAGSFRSDENLTLIYVPSSIKCIDNDLCYGCKNLEKVYLPGVESVFSITLRNLTSLKYVKFGSGISDIGESAFNGCAAGAVYDFSAASNVPALNVFTPGEEFGTEPVIKVPAALYEEWKADTNWVYYADYIVAAE